MTLHLSLDWVGASEPWPARCHLLYPEAQAGWQPPSHSHVFEPRPAWLIFCMSPDAAAQLGHNLQAEEPLKPSLGPAASKLMPGGDLKP